MSYIYVDAKDDRFHESRHCPTISAERQPKLQRFCDDESARQEFTPCSFCYPTRANAA